jgi:glyoxylase-like metal-dependent hydrolase (beta-lactamase superfamily II)
LTERGFSETFKLLIKKNTSLSFEMNPLLIEIKQDIPGFENFIGTWVCQDDINVIFDVGPPNSISRLIDSLKSISISRIDYVVLTHIHIDHAGGLADFFEYFPMAKAVCHARGIRHLNDPARLWAGSLDALGLVAEAYGQPKPVSLDRFISHTEVNIPEMKIIETPGHAAHHLSILYKGILFSGEAAGNYFNFNGINYLRPATPPVLFLDEFIQSVDKLVELGDRPICFSHFGEAESSREIFLRFKAQVTRWKEIVAGEMTGVRPGLIDRCVERLILHDPELKAFESLKPEIQARERYFISNSIKGFIGFLGG